MKQNEELITEHVKPNDAQNETAQKATPAKKSFLRDICYIALFAAIITVCSYLAIPIGEISVTLQTFAVCAAAGLLGWKRGVLSVVIYILLGICGIPVFSGFKNFYALLGGASAGYVIGFLFTALLTGFATDNLHKIGDKAKNKTLGQITELIMLVIAMIIGVAVCYFFGTFWFMTVYKGSVSAENLQTALTFCVYPFIVPDLIKIIIAAILVNRLKRFVK